MRYCTNVRRETVMHFKEWDAEILAALAMLGVILIGSALIAAGVIIG